MSACAAYRSPPFVVELEPQQPRRRPEGAGSEPG
jgi:hypothetical protein